MNAITKNQHYVPQFLLRNFANEQKGISRLNVFDIAQNQFRRNQNVKHICSENYFYDKDNQIERFLDKNVETPAAKVVQSLCAVNPVIEKRPSQELVKFVSVQISRTAEALKQSQDFVDGMTKTIFREMARLNGFDEEAAEQVRLVPSEPRQISSRLALNGCIAWLLIHDLEQHLLINHTSEEFVISDHPVVHTNVYLYGVNILNTGSLSVAGVQLFLPISPKRVLCLYDPLVYKYGERNSRITEIHSVDSVQAINVLQIRNNPRVLMFCTEDTHIKIRQLSNRWHSKPLWEYKSFFNPAQPIIGSSEMKSLHAVAKFQQEPCISLPFFKVKNEVQLGKIRSDERIPEAVKAFERIMAKFRDEE